MSVAKNRLFYASSVLAESSMKMALSRATLVMPQEQTTLRIMRCYRTVLDIATLMLAGTPLADLLVTEDARVRDLVKNALLIEKMAIRKGSERINTTISSHERIYTTEITKVAWIRRLLPNLKRWLERSSL